MVSVRALQSGLALLAQSQINGRKITPAGLQVYAAVLRDLDDQEFHEACLEHCRRSQWFPSPQNLLEAARGNDGDLAERLWLVVESAVRTKGRYASVSFHPAANAAVRSMGGWLKLCEAGEADLHFRRGEFLASCRSFLRCPPGREGEHLAGLEERAHVAALGRWGGEVVLLGPGAEAPEEYAEALPDPHERVLRLVAGAITPAGEEF